MLLLPLQYWRCIWAENSKLMMELICNKLLLKLAKESNGWDTGVAITQKSLYVRVVTCAYAIIIKVLMLALPISEWSLIWGMLLNLRSSHYYGFQECLNCTELVDLIYNSAQEKKKRNLEVIPCFAQGKYFFGLLFCAGMTRAQHYAFSGISVGHILCDQFHYELLHLFRIFFISLSASLLHSKH